MEFYRRHLPHIHPLQAIFFITFRLVNSLPLWIIENLKTEFSGQKILTELNKQDPFTKLLPSEYHRRYFEESDAFLDKQMEGNQWLHDSRIASIVAEAIHYRDGSKYDLICYCIMPNHVHMIVEITDKYNQMNTNGTTYLTRVMQSLKSYTAISSNDILQRSGQFWQRENYDRVIRNEQELENVIKYVIYNPVKAGLAAEWKDWKFTFCKYNLP